MAQNPAENWAQTWELLSLLWFVSGQALEIKHLRGDSWDIRGSDAGRDILTLSLSGTETLCTAPLSVVLDRGMAGMSLVWARDVPEFRCAYGALGKNSSVKES